MIRVVTDSVASIPADMLEGKPVEVVSLYVNHEGVEYVDAEMNTDTFYSDMYSMVDNIPTSSQPSQETLEKVFLRIAQAGDELLGVFISTGLSGTFNTVVQAAQAVKKQIPDFKFALIDSHSCGFDEGWPALRALEAIGQGFDLSRCAEAVMESMKASRFLFTPETLTFLQKGGRIGNATALLGNLIQLSPVLTVIEGKTATVTKVRLRKKALERMFQEFKKDIESYGLKDVVVHYIGDKLPAMEWAKTAIDPFVGKAVKVIPVSPVIGMHVGPAIGIAYECERAMPYKFPNGLPPLIYT